MSRLDGRVVVVTGGAGDAIGQGISSEVVDAGGRLAILDIDIARANAIAKELGNERVLAIEADVSSETAVSAAFDRIGKECGTVDVLVNSAGVGLIRPPHEASLAEFKRLVEIDLQGVWLCCKYALPFMLKRQRGSIVNIGSVHGTRTLPGYPLYAGVKAGLGGFTRGLAVQYGPQGIRANLIAPGLVDGKQTREVLKNLGHDPDAWIADFLRRRQSLRTPVDPRDIGRAVVFLASDDARAITGVELAVDGGTLPKLSSDD